MQNFKINCYFEEVGESIDEIFYNRLKDFIYEKSTYSV